ncbi:hypothetical protein [Halobacteriovorax sp. RT-2-4]|uniref:hypothetical protein n=1 Tax=unclassified Halobacteriovorax TaxID=2639665 RepID=UPI00399AAE5C
MKKLLILISTFCALNVVASQALNQFPLNCGIFEGNDMNAVEGKYTCDEYRIIAFTLSADGSIKKNALNAKCYSSYGDAYSDYEKYRSIDVCK